MEVHGFTDEGLINITRDGARHTVPDTPEDRERWGISEWEKAGNTIPPYQAPASPTVEERIDAAFPGTDSARVIFEALYELINEVRALKGQGAISRTQARDWLKAKLPSR